MTWARKVLEYARRPRRRQAGVPLARREGDLVAVGAVRGGEPDRSGGAGPRSPVGGRRVHPAARHRDRLRDRAAAAHHRGRRRRDDRQPAPRPPRRLARRGGIRRHRADADALRVADRGRRRQRDAGALRLGGALLAPQAGRRRVADAAGDAGPQSPGRPGGFGSGGFGSAGFGSGGFGSGPRNAAPPPAPLGLDVDVVVAALGERAEQAKLDAPDARALPPASAWSWIAIAAVLAPALLLAIVAAV